MSTTLIKPDNLDDLLAAISDVDTSGVDYEAIVNAVLRGVLSDLHWVMAARLVGAVKPGDPAVKAAIAVMLDVVGEIGRGFGVDASGVFTPEYLDQLDG